MKIPHTAYFVYGEHAVNPMPNTGFTNISDFTRLNLGWSSRFITLDNFNPEHADIFEWNKLAWSQVARYELVFNNGGLYSDVDIEFYGPLPTMDGCDMVIACETHGGVSDAFFAARQGHHILGECFEKSVQWCRRKMGMGVKNFTTEDLFNGCGVTFFTKTVKARTGFNMCYEQQLHMTQHDFGGRFHPENGVGILPFEALCRHNSANWVGWHRCVGTWRPRTEAGEKDMRMEACLKANLTT